MIEMGCADDLFEQIVIDFADLFPREAVSLPQRSLWQSLLRAGRSGMAASHCMPDHESRRITR
jgi:hypothetical protein